MSDRQYHEPQTQGWRHVYMTLQIIGNGASAPSLGEGDPKGTYFTVSRTTTGTYLLKTKNPFPGSVGVDANIMSATDTNAWSVTPKLPVQNADHTWSFELVTFEAGT